VDRFSDEEFADWGSERSLLKGIYDETLGIALYTSAALADAAET
jgi:hypothetical protein